ncbi:MAG: DnaJ domain-containing protein [Phycisphaerales bacterium]
MSPTAMPPATDPFAMLGLRATFDLTREQIERAYLAKAAALHPDTAGDDAARDAAERGSAALNQAARTLRDRERRANALLAHVGGPTKEADRSLPDGFLAQIMETRMQIEADAGDAEARARWERWAETERDAFARSVSAQFAALAVPATPESLAEIRRTLNAWRYIERLIEQLDPAYDPARADFEA